MTSKLTKKERVQALYDLKIGQVLSLDDIENVKMLARMALAAMDSEPVAWMHSNNDIGIPAITVSQKIGHYWMAEFENVQPLYRHAQPAPVVPDVMEPTIEAIKRILPTSNPDEYAACIGADMWNACRATMLQAGNSPVIPDDCSAKFGNFQHYWHSKGYILVPTEPTESMCDISHIGVDVYCGITDDNEYYSIGGAEAAKVWKAMLAAAPQEVK